MLTPPHIPSDTVKNIRAEKIVLKNNVDSQTSIDGVTRPVGTSIQNILLEQIQRCMGIRHQLVMLISGILFISLSPQAYRIGQTYRGADSPIIRNPDFACKHGRHLQIERLKFTFIDII